MDAMSTARAAVLTGFVLAAIAGCAGKGAVDQSVDNSLGFQAGSGAVVYSSGHRYAAETLSGTTVDNQPFSSTAYKGDIVVVNFWASWCGPCRSEADTFNQVATDDKSAGVRFLGINTRDNQSAAQSFERTHHVPYPSLFDRTGALGFKFPKAAPSTTPTTIVLDRQGKIAAKVSGALDYTHLRKLVDKISSESA